MRQLIPRYITQRNPDLQTDGDKVAAVSKLLGHPLIPWQQLAADIAGEYGIDEQGRKVYVHPRVIITVPRQAGKTTLDQARHVRSMMLAPNRVSYYIAQRGKDSNANFKKLVDTIDKSPLRKLVKQVKRGAGDTVLRFTNGSEFRPSPPVLDEGHGMQSDLVTLDEIWALNDDTGNGLMQAFLPTFITRLALTGQQPQLVLMSTEGTADSTFFNTILSDCRHGNIPPDWAFIDFGLPFDQDPEDLEAVWKYHPGAGHLFTRKQLSGFRQEFKNDPAGWRRAFCNIRDDGSTERVYTQDIWEQAQVQQITISNLHDIALGVAVDIDQASTSIALAGIDDNDTVCAMLLAQIPGAWSAPDQVQAYAQQYQCHVYADRKGPASTLVDTLDDGVNFADITPADIASTGMSMLEMLRAQSIRIASSAQLDTAASVAVRRWSGDTWYLDRRNSPGDISPIEALQLAVWGARHHVKPVPLQIFAL